MKAFSLLFVSHILNRQRALPAACAVLFFLFGIFAYTAANKPPLIKLIETAQATHACGECSPGQCWNSLQARPCTETSPGCFEWTDPITTCTGGEVCNSGSGCGPPTGGCPGGCARNEICSGNSCMKLCDDACGPICSGGASCGGGDQSQCLDGTNGARLGLWVEDNPDTQCKTGKKIWLERRVCGDFEPEPNGGICYEWGEEQCPNRFGCIDPPWAAKCKPFNDAACELVDTPDRIVVGNLYTGQIRIENKGIVTWCPWKANDPPKFPNTKRPTTAYALGAENPKFNKIWGTEGRLFPPELEVRVSPNEDVYFRWRFKAPNLPGTYPFDWRMVLQNVPALQGEDEWFGDMCHKDINDRPIPVIHNVCPLYDKQLGSADCYKESQKEPGVLGTSTCAADCSDCINKCQDLMGQNAIHLFDSTTGRCGCEAVDDWNPEAARGLRSTCNSKSGQPPYFSCMVGGNSGIPCESIDDCKVRPHRYCDYATQSCKERTGYGISQCGGINAASDLCSLDDAPPNSKTCGGKYDISNPLGNFGDPTCDFSKDQLAKLLVQLDPEKWQFWYFTIAACESAYDPNSYSPDVVDPDGAWGLFKMGRGRNGPFDRGDVSWRRQAYNAVQYNKQIGETFAYWQCAPNPFRNASPGS